MAAFKPIQWIALASAIVAIVLLMFAPHHSGKFESDETIASAEADDLPDTEYMIDSALNIIQGKAPMQGILLLRQVAEENPSNFRAQYHLGRFSAQTGQWEKVIERFDAVKRIDPEFAESDYWIGMANFQMGNNEQAEISLQQFVDVEQDNVELLRDAQTMLNQLK